METLIEYLPIIAPIILIQLILLIIAFIDIVKVKETNGPKWMWAIIVVCINIIGPVAYFIFGRKEQ